MKKIIGKLQEVYIDLSRRMVCLKIENSIKININAETKKIYYILGKGQELREFDNEQDYYEIVNQIKDFDLN